MAISLDVVPILLGRVIDNTPGVFDLEYLGNFNRNAFCNWDSNVIARRCICVLEYRHTWHKKYTRASGWAYRERPILNERWIVLEGVIMDRPYFVAVRRLLLESGRTMGYAIGMTPEVLAGCDDGRCLDWGGEHDVTCQMTAVAADHGAAADAEAFYRQHALTGLRRLLFERHVSQEMTRRAARIRRGEIKS